MSKQQLSMCSAIAESGDDHGVLLIVRGDHLVVVQWHKVSAPKVAADELEAA